MKKSKYSSDNGKSSSRYYDDDLYLSKSEDKYLSKTKNKYTSQNDSRYPSSQIDEMFLTKSEKYASKINNKYISKTDDSYGSKDNDRYGSDKLTSSVDRSNRYDDASREKSTSDQIGRDRDPVYTKTSKSAKAVDKVLLHSGSVFPEPFSRKQKKQKKSKEERVEVIDVDRKQHNGHGRHERHRGSDSHASRR